jgi:hypothetical protein
LPEIRSDPRTSPDTEVENVLKTARPIGSVEPKDHMRLVKTRPPYKQEVTGSRPVPPIVKRMQLAALNRQRAADVPPVLVNPDRASGEECRCRVLQGADQCLTHVSQPRLLSHSQRC